MTAHAPYATLPDPHAQRAFYQDVPLKRLLAFVFDLAVIFALTFLVAIFTFGLGFFLFFGIFALVGFIYRVATLAGGSATLGMRMMAIELRTHRGDRFGFAEALIHTIAFYISFGVFPVQAISVAMMLTTSRGQGLTDMLLGTVALNRRAQS